MSLHDKIKQVISYNIRAGLAYSFAPKYVKDSLMIANERQELVSKLRNTIGFERADCLIEQWESECRTSGSQTFSDYFKSKVQEECKKVLFGKIE